MLCIGCYMQATVIFQNNLFKKYFNYHFKKFPKSFKFLKSSVFRVTIKIFTPI